MAMPRSVTYDVVEALIESGAETHPERVVRPPLTSFILEENLGAVYALLENGAKITNPDDALCPWWNVVRHGSSCMLRCFVRQGMDATTRLNGKSALFEAIEYGNTENVIQLINFGLDYTEVDDNDDSKCPKNMIETWNLMEEKD